MSKLTLAVLALMCAMSCIFVLGGMLPNYLTDYLKLTPTQMGFVTSALGFGGFVGQFGVPGISDKLGRRPTAVLAFIGAAVAWLIFNGNRNSFGGFVVFDLAVTPRFHGRENEPAVARLTVDFNAALTRQARRYGVEVVDLYKPSQTEIPRQPELLAADGYHPSDLGYARWAELLWVGVERRIGHRSARAE